MHFEPVSEDLIGQIHPTDHFTTNFEQYEQTVLSAAVAHGYPAALWPSGAPFLRVLVHRAMRTGTLPMTIPTSKSMERNTYSGPKQHELVIADFRRDFGMIPNAIFVITEGEDWWPHDKAFLAHDANSFMQYSLYFRARTHKEVLVEPPKRGRPRNEAAHAAKAEKSSRYQEWLAECEAYRTRHNELKEAYLKALAEYTAWKEQGAPKWIP